MALIFRAIKDQMSGKALVASKELSQVRSLRKNET